MEAYMTWLLQVKGQHFLIVFLVYALMVLMGAYLINRQDGTHNSFLYEREMPDPIAVAVLRGGWQAVVQTVIFQLLERGILEISRIYSKNSFVCIARDEKLTPLEQFIMKSLLTKQSVRGLYRDSEFKKEMENYLKQSTLKLEQLRLFKDEELRRRSSSIFWLSALLLFLMAVPKLYLGLTWGKPVSFLVLLLLIALVALWFIVIKVRLTTFGKLYWNILKKRFQWAREDFRSGGNDGGLEPAYFVALFGVGVFSGSLFFEDFQRAFGVRSSGGGCSGFSGGCSGSSSGGGCSSGCSGGGGGGCGGCGGGGD